MAVNLSNAESKKLNELVVPQLLEVYGEVRGAFTDAGWKLVERSLKKPLVTSDKGISRAFEPAMLLGFTTEVEVLWRLFEIGKQIPFWGNYAVWASVRALNATLYRKLSLGGDGRVVEVERYLSFADNGGKPGPPVFGDAMQNVLRGDLLQHYRTEFESPIPAYLYSHFITRNRVLAVMWAFGGSAEWPRPALEAELARSADVIAYALSEPPNAGV